MMRKKKKRFPKIEKRFHFASLNAMLSLTTVKFSYSVSKKIDVFFLHFAE